VWFRGIEVRKIHKSFPDAKFLTERQRQKLCEMIYHALLEMRVLGWGGKAEQAADLADAFHNLPAMLWREGFSLDFFQKFLEAYRQKYPDGGGAGYLKMLDEVIAIES
jgi:hypothetical protein